MSKKGKIIVYACLFLYFMASGFFVNRHYPEYAVEAMLINIILCTIVLTIIFLPKRNKDKQ